MCIVLAGGGRILQGCPFRMVVGRKSLYRNKTINPIQLNAKCASAALAVTNTDCTLPRPPPCNPLMPRHYLSPKKKLQSTR